MTIWQLIVGAVITCILVFLCQQEKIPAPFHWIVYAIMVVLWLVALAAVLGYGGLLGQRVA